MTDPVAVRGAEAADLTTRLLQRRRLADPHHGIWEAADPQWWSRVPRPSDDVDRLFWLDDEGPVAGVLLTCWREVEWQCDPVVVRRAPAAPSLADVLTAGLEQVRQVAVGTDDVVHVPTRDDDTELVALARAAGLRPGETSCTAWMDAVDAPPVHPPPAGYTLRDRATHHHRPHPMIARNGAAIQDRLAACSLYDPALDLSVETADGEAVGYVLHWLDPVTRVGLVEPVRVEDDHSRRGLAKAMITEGISRLVARGAERIKIGFETEAAGSLYLGLGFRLASTDTWWEGSVPDLARS